jgi:hypothetical protein
MAMQLHDSTGMMDALLNYLLGCNHKKTTFPRTRAANFRNPTRGNRSTYIACLKCGAEFAYDWERMRVGVSLPTQKGFLIREEVGM